MTGDRWFVTKACAIGIYMVVGLWHVACLEPKKRTVQAAIGFLLFWPAVTVAYFIYGRRKRA